VGGTATLGGAPKARADRSKATSSVRDVAMNLQRVDEGAALSGLSSEQVAHVRHGVLRLIAAIDAAPKGFDVAQ